MQNRTTIPTARTRGRFCYWRKETAFAQIETESLQLREDFVTIPFYNGTEKEGLSCIESL